MKALFRSAKIIGSGSLLALVLSFSASAYAGPGPDYWQRMARAQADSKAKPASATETPSKPVPAAMACEACQTVILRDSGWIGPPSKGRRESFIVGAKHTCEHCGGEIKVVRGTVTNSMQHNCPTCKDAVRCSVAVQTPTSRT